MKKKDSAYPPARSPLNRGRKPSCWSRCQPRPRPRNKNGQIKNETFLFNDTLFHDVFNSIQNTLLCAGVAAAGIIILLDRKKFGINVIVIVILGGGFFVFACFLLVRVIIYTRDKMFYFRGNKRSWRNIMSVIIWEIWVIFLVLLFMISTVPIISSILKTL